MRVTLTKQQAFVAKTANRDKEPEPLRYIRIGDGFVTAADGFTLARAPIEYDGESVFVPAQMIPAGTCDLELDGDSVRIITVDGTYETTHRAVAYPNIATYWKKWTRRKPKACIALNVAVLRQMLACIEGKDGGKAPNGIVRLYLRTPSDPVEWRVQTRGDGVLVEGIIMPMFVNWGDK